LCRDELLVFIYKIVFEAIQPRHLTSADEIAWGDILEPMAFRRESGAVCGGSEGGSAFFLEANVHDSAGAAGTRGGCPILVSRIDDHAP
jgi:hypothetical protein